jgi:acyl-CoA thioester hydrolase
MARVTVDLPASFRFSTELPIYIGYINRACHLDNAALIALLAEARLRFFNALGYDELAVEGVGIVIADTLVQYRSEAFHGEILRFELEPAEFNKYGFDLYWRAVVASPDGGREVARGKLGILFFDYGVRWPSPIPSAFLERLGEPIDRPPA